VHRFRLLWEWAAVSNAQQRTKRRLLPLLTLCCCCCCCCCHPFHPSPKPPSKPHPTRETLDGIEVVLLHLTLPKLVKYGLHDNISRLAE
jgi:hypothetical protein